MTEHKSNELAATSFISGAVYDGRVKRFKATVALKAQAAGDTIILAEVPKDYVFAYGVINSSVSLGTATIAVGSDGASEKYRSAAVITSADTPVLFGKNAAVAELADNEKIVLTVGAAALPASGILIVDLFFSAM